MAYEELEQKRSYFNAGVAMAERIDALQRALNASRFNPFIFNMETGTYNYQIMINSLNSLLSECWGKLTNDEKTLGKKFDEVIGEYARLNPPITNKTSQRNGISEPVVDMKAWEKLRPLLLIYERQVKEFLEAHDMNSPNKDWDDDEGY